MASASSLFNFLRTLAGSIGTSLTTFLWYNREAVHHSQLTEAITPYNPNAQQYYQMMERFGMGEEQTSSLLARNITSQGFIIGANEIFWLSAVLFFGVIYFGLVCQTAFWKPTIKCSPKKKYFYFYLQINNKPL